MTEQNFTFDGHTAFDLESLPVTKLAKVLRALGERGDFARVRKERQIAMIEQRHPIERQAQALRSIGEDPEALRLTDTSHARSAIGAVMQRRGGGPPGEDPPAVDAPPAVDLDHLIALLSQLLTQQRPPDADMIRQLVREELAAQARRLADDWGN